MNENKKFPLGFWNYHGLGSDVQKPEEAKRWAECGMTLTISPRFSYKSNTVQEMIDMLDACHENGIRLFIDIPELHYLQVKNEEEYRATVKRAYDDFGSHPATFGFFVADEPATTEMTNLCVKAYRIQKEIAPTLNPYVNHLAEWEGMDIGDRTFVQWLRDYVEDSKTWMISFDHYGQMIKNDPGIESWYKNLKYYCDTAIDYDIEMWVTVLGSAHFRFLPPDDDAARWQLSTAVACGAKGVFWYMFYGGILQGDCNYRLAPIDEFNEKSKTFYSIKRAQDHFQRMHGEMFTQLKIKKLYQFHRCYGNIPEYKKGDHDGILAIESPNGVPGILSFFEDKDGKEYVVLCNNSPSKSGQFKFVLDKTKVMKFTRVGENGTAFHTFARQSEESMKNAKEGDYLVANMWLAPGQLEMFIME